MSSTARQTPADAPSIPSGCPVAHGAGPRTQALAAETAAAPDKGYFGPESVSWRIYSDPSVKLGGAAALLLQALNPSMMRLFAETSVSTTDGAARFERTGRYLDTTIFGDTELADAAGQAVQRLHANSKWTDPHTGQELHADTPEWLVWTHNTLVWGLLRAADAFGPALAPDEQDRFVLEQHAAARLVGIDPDAVELARTREELDAYIDGQSGWMALTLPAAAVSRELRKPSLKGNPVKVWTGIIIQDAILSLLPEWALELYGTAGRPMNLPGAAKAARRILVKARQSTDTAAMISDITARVETHPYRRVKRRAA